MVSSQFRSIKKPHLFAHRGGNAAGVGKENSMRAFNSAVQLGYKFLETDVIATRDGKAICYHGSFMWGDKKISGLEVRRKLQKLTYSQIMHRFTTKDKEMPLLEEVLQKFSNNCFSLDVKTKEAIEPTVKVIKSLKAENRVIITSFSLKRSLRANRLLRGTDKQAALCVSRVSPWIRTPFNWFFLPYLKLRGVGYLEVSYRRVNRILILLAHKYGIYVYAWTINSEEDIKKMLSLKVDGIMSDESRLLLKTAKNKKV